MFKRKRYLKMLMSLLLTAFLAPPAHAETLTVSDGTDGSTTTTNRFVPCDAYNFDGTGYYGQMIYPADMLTALNGKRITKVTFFAASNFTKTSQPNLSLSFGIVDNTTLSGALTNLNNVGSGTMTNGSPEMVMTLSQGYIYNGGNLAIEVKTAAGVSGSWMSSSFVYNGIEKESSSYAYNQGVQNFLPKVEFTYEDVLENAASVSNEVLDFGDISFGTPKVLELSLSNTGTNSFTPEVSISGDGFTTSYTPSLLASGETAIIPVTFNPSQVGEFTGTLHINAGLSGTFDVEMRGSSSLKATIYEDATGYLNSLPISGSYYDQTTTLGQMIYPAADLTSLVGKIITGFTFYNYSGYYDAVQFSGGNLLVSLGSTEQTSYSYSNPTSVADELTPVANVSVVGGGTTLDIVFDNPYLYEGGNLVVDMKVTEAGTPGATYFVGKSLPYGNYAAYDYTRNLNARNFLPKVTVSFADESLGYLSVTPTSLSFGGDKFYVGQTSEAQTFTVKNTTSEAVTISAPDGADMFTFTPSLPLTVAAGSSEPVTVSVVYNPTAAGEHTATIAVGEKTVTLNGKAVEASIDVTPAELTFGGESFIQGVTAAETKQVTITNNSPEAITTALAVNGDGAVMFNLGENVTIAANQTATVSVTYNPTAAGTHTAVLTVVEGKTVNLTGTAVAPVISGTVTPDALTFECQEGKTATDKITIANSGNTAFTPVFSALEAPFSIEAAVEIAAGASKEFTVTYAPEAVGKHTATLNVSINGALTEVALNGVATEAPKEVTVADGSNTSSYVPVYGLYYDFYYGNTNQSQMIYPSTDLNRLVGKQIKAITFYVRGSKGFYGGKLAVSLGTTENSSYSSAERLGNLTKVYEGEVAQTTGSEWKITFTTPFIYNGGNLVIDTEQLEAGEDASTSFYGKTQTLNTSYNIYTASGGSNTSTLVPFLPKVMFTYDDAAPEVTVSTNELLLGGENFAYGSTDTKKFKVTNTTDAGVVVQVVDDDNNVFTVEPTTIEAGAINAEVTVTYSPAAAGTHTATVTVGDKTVTLTGTAVEPVISGTVTPTELTFRAYVDADASQQITIENTGNTAFTPVFTTAAPFSIEAATKIAVGESKNFNVTYHPTELDIHSGTLEVAINNNVTEVTLSGISSMRGDDVTVDDGTDVNHVVPFYGWYSDVTYNVYGQFIYPAADLTNLVGKDINAIKFYSSTGVQFSGATFDVTIGTTNLTEFSGTQRVAIADGVTASVTPANGDAEIEITFNEPFRYLGGNLIVDTYGTLRGKCDPSDGATKYYGVTQTTNTAIHSKAGASGSPGYAQFLPKITFSISEPAATDIATLNDLCLNGEANKKYTIKESLRAAYKKGYTVWFKDDNKFANKDEVVEPQNNFEIQFGDIVWNSKDDFDQSNWIEVVFPENLFPGELLHPGTDLDTEYPFVMVKNLTGTFTKENGNPKLEVLMAVTSSDVTGTEQYDPNLYSPANFAGTQPGHYLKDGNTVNCDYFFVTPKPQEFAKILYAVYSNGTLTMTENQNGVSGTVSVDLSKNSGTGLVDGNVYSNFDVIICKETTTASPRLKAQGDSYKVYPLNLTADKDVTTAISTISINGGVKSVKYVSVAGLVSNRPFEGVNIVVTEYTDGSRTTTKMVR